VRNTCIWYHGRLVLTTRGETLPGLGAWAVRNRGVTGIALDREEGVSQLKCIKDAILGMETYQLAMLSWDGINLEVGNELGGEVAAVLSSIA